MRCAVLLPTYHSFHCVLSQSVGLPSNSVDCLLIEMSESVEKIERLRHQLREMEREVRESERIRKNLALECDIEGSLGKVDDEGPIKEEIMRTWMNDFDNNVQCILDNEAGDNSWLEVVGDVMDELRQRVADDQKGVENSEVDLRSILALIDEDAKNLGELCAELLQKFMSRRVMVEKEKCRRRNLPLSEIDGETKAANADGFNVTSIDDGASKIGEESKDVKCLQETLVELSMGDFESKETKPESVAGQESKDNNAETIGDHESKATIVGNQVTEEIPAQNCIKFTIVDEKGRPLGAKAEVAAEADGEIGPVDVARPITPDHEDDIDTPDNCPASPREEACASPTLASVSSGQPTTEPTTGEIWFEVASLIDQNRDNDVLEILETMFTADDDSDTSTL